MLGQNSSNTQSYQKEGWTITTQRGPIANQEMLDKTQQALGFSPPEMLFTSNRLELKHAPSSVCISFEALAALERVDAKSAPIQVALSPLWAVRYPLGS